MTERLLTTNHITAASRLCDVTERERGEFFVQCAVSVTNHFAAHTHSVTHTRGLLFLHADYTSGTVKPPFYPEGPNGVSHG